MLQTPQSVGAPLFVRVNPPTPQHLSCATPAAFAFAGSFHATAYVIGTHGVVALSTEHEGISAWTDFVAVGAYDEALAHLQDQLLALQLSDGPMGWGPDLGPWIGVGGGEMSPRVEGQAPSKQRQLQVAQGTVRLAQATAARERGVHTWHLKHALP